MSCKSSFFVQNSNAQTKDSLNYPSAIQIVCESSECVSAKRNGTQNISDSSKAPTIFIKFPLEYPQRRSHTFFDTNRLLNVYQSN